MCVCVCCVSLCLHHVIVWLSIGGHEAHRLWDLFLSLRVQCSTIDRSHTGRKTCKVASAWQNLVIVCYRQTSCVIVCIDGGRKNWKFACGCKSSDEANKIVGIIPKPFSRMWLSFTHHWVVLCYIDETLLMVIILNLKIAYKMARLL